MKLTAKDKKLLRAKVEKHSAKPNENGCILWIGWNNEYGYGRVWFRKRGQKAHRVAWMLAKGEIPKGLCVCHKCDVRLCVNVDHLFLGTRADNMADRERKNRGVSGEKCGRHKLTQKQVDEIRTKYSAGNITQQELADVYGVGRTAVWKIVTNKTWKGSVS